ncbi:MAG: GWxTD domain-containing protein [Candidatus Marinimicrobia bacterium]|nr:GWxTD domain-containing protein [Candidatus Neomarinimicrobiota bacterium]
MRKIRNYVLVLLFSMVLIPNSVLASKNKIPFALDYASFSDQQGPSIVEIYYSINRGHLTWKKQKDGKFIGTCWITTTLYSDKKAIFSNEMELNDVTSDTLSVKSNQKIPDQLMLRVSPGNYQLVVKVKDAYSEKSSTLQISMEVKSFSSDSLDISDIEIGSYAVKTVQENKFTKFGMYDIIPYAQREYSEELSDITIYTEIYNLTVLSDKANNYTYWFEILSLDDEIVKTFGKKTFDTPGNYSMIIDKFNVADLKPGIYYGNLNVVDNNNGQKASVREKIYFTGPAEELQTNELIAEMVKNKSKSELDSIFNNIKCLMGNKEKRMFKKSNLTGKQSFLIGFWERKDPNIKTPANEYRIMIEKRINYAIEKYSTSMTRGPLTDRGIAIIKYGEPDEIEKKPSTADTSPYEIWQYYGMEGGVMFVFYDPNGFGDYELLHSSKRGERHDSNWESKIKNTVGGFDSF